MSNEAFLQQVNNRVQQPPVSIVNFFSAGGVSFVAGNYTSNKSILSGALTANVLKSVFSLSGSGQVDTAYVVSNDTTGRLIRLQITIDGTIVFDATSSAVSATNSGIMGIGHISYYAVTQFIVEPSPVFFRNSFEVKVASTRGETSGILFLTSYQLF